MWHILFPLDSGGLELSGVVPTAPARFPLIQCVFLFAAWPADAISLLCG